MKRIIIVLLAAIFLTGSYIFLSHNIAASLTPAAADAPAVDASGANIAGEVVDTENEAAEIDPALSNDWFGKAVAHLQISEYRISWQTSTYLEDLPAAYQAPNRAQDLRTYFTPEGVRLIQRTGSDSSWELGITLTRYGYGGQVQPVAEAEMAATQNQIDYQRGDLTEWYLNSEKGLQQGFTLDTPPAHAGVGETLVMELALTGDLLPSLTADEVAIEFKNASGESVLHYGGLQVYDSSGVSLPARVQLMSDQSGSQSAILTVKVIEASYPITISSMITNPSAPESTTGLSSTYDWGAVGTDENAQLGYSVSTAGDVDGDGGDDVIIGAPYYDFGHQEEGGAFLYISRGDGLSFTSTWHIESNQDRAHLGISVSDAGDVNNDGYDDVIIGAPDYDNGLDDQGRVYVFFGSADGLTDTLKMTIDGDAALVNFGTAVGTAGDVDNDGYDDIIVGVPAYGDGKVFVYHGSDTGPITTTYWTAENTTTTNFGVSVDTAGDVNNDGFDDVIIGGSEMSGGGGLAVVYHGSAISLSTSADWSISESVSNAEFGFSVGDAGDVNGDGYGDVIVGAPSYGAGNELGRVYVYHGSASGLHTTEDWAITGVQDGAAFGYSVGAAGDLNGDGYTEVIIGAPFFSNAGRAYVYKGTSQGLEAGVYWWSESDKLISYYGFSVGTAGNVNGDRTDDVLIGAPLYYVALPSQGAVVVFYGKPDITATNDSPTVLGEFTTMTATVSTSGAFAYDWDFGDGITETGRIVTHTYSEVGYFTATVTADDSTYVISTTTPVTITDVTIAGLLAENDSPTPFEHITTLTASVSAGTNVVYNWDFGDGITGSGAVITHTYPAVDVFTATVTATNNISSDVVTTTVTITEAAIEGLAAENDSPTALGDTTTLSATVAYGSSVGYEWAYGDGNSGVGITTTHKYAVVGAYTATVTATNSLGTDSVTTTVTIEEPISGLNAENDSPTQLGDTTTLSATITAGSNVSYNWGFGDGEYGNGINTSHVYPQVGSFTATITASNGVSSLSTTTPVTITDVPIADLSASNDSPTPIGSATTLSATISAGSNVSYEWDFGDGENGIGITTTHIYPNTGYYTATVTATNSVSSDAVTTTLTINDIPIAGLVADNDSPTLIGYTTLLSATISAGSNVNYEWDFGDGTLGTGVSVSHIYPAFGGYTATVTATNSIGFEVATTTVTIKEKVTATIHLVPGWNLVTLPIIPETAYKAQSMLDEIRIGGGSCDEIDRWLNGGWDAHIDRLPFNDFDINVGEGYFLKCSTTADWNINGMEMWEEVPFNLVAGWNLIGLAYPPNTYKAQSLLDRFNSEGDFCSEVDRWLNGGWDAHVDGLPFNDFDIAPDQGYFIKCSSVNNTLDLSISKGDGGVTASPSSVIAYTLNYSNTGTIMAAGVIITETLPASTSFNPDQSDPGWAQVGATDMYTYSVGELGPDISSVITFAVTVDGSLPGGLTTITNTVEIGDDGTQLAEQTPDDNTATIYTPVAAGAAGMNSRLEIGWIPGSEKRWL